MQMNKDQEFMITRLEEKMFDIAEQEIYDGNSIRLRSDCSTNDTYRVFEVPSIDTECHSGGSQLRQVIFYHQGLDG